MRRWAIAAGVILIAWAALRLSRPPLFEGVARSRAVYAAGGELLRLSLASDEKYRLWLPLAEISPALVAATLEHEDRWFRWHPGVNPAALARAIFSTYGGARRMGGSTITMQLARIRYGLRTDRPLGKFWQIVRALALEASYSKNEILEAYLNLAPYGGNIEGAGAASLVYFHKPAAKLVVEEALALSQIPQSPARRDPTQAASRRALAAAFARAGGKIFPRFFGYDALPFEAPHFVEVVQRAAGEGRVVTTLDLGLQKIVARKLGQYVEAERHLGIDNAAALLVDARSMAVVAEVGSVDFFDAAIDGQVNGTLAKRSPGSALKPFIYALAIDQGLIHPETMLKDAPLRFSGFNPENFDGDFVGPIKAREALIHSRNVPAVQLAAELKAPSLYQLLQRAGVSGLKNEDFYGLALALGGAEVTMEELARLYAALGHRGEMRPITRLQGRPQGAALRLFSPESSHMVLEILRTNPRPGRGFRADMVRDRAPIAWKTGTSHGFRDAWSVGLFGPYVLAVWVGRFDGEGNPAFVGVKAAAPLFFNIVDALRAHDGEWPPPPGAEGLNITAVEVCAASGALPGPECPHRVTTAFIPGVSPIKRCDIHRRVFVDSKTGRQACRFDPARDHGEVFEFWPSDLARLFAAAGLPRRSPPPRDPACAFGDAGEGRAPHITSPEARLDYTVRTREASKIPLSAVTDAASDDVYWFVDQAYLGKVKSGELLFWPARPGHFVVRAVDGQGRADARELQVSLVD